MYINHQPISQQFLWISSIFLVCLPSLIAVTPIYWKIDRGTFFWLSCTRAFDVKLAFSVGFRLVLKNQPCPLPVILACRYPEYVTSSPFSMPRCSLLDAPHSYISFDVSVSPSVSIHPLQLQKIDVKVLPTLGRHQIKNRLLADTNFLYWTSPSSYTAKWPICQWSVCNSHAAAPSAMSI